MTTLSDHRTPLVRPDEPLGGIFAAAFQEHGGMPGRAKRTVSRPALLTVLARTLGTLAGIAVDWGMKARTGVLSVAGLGFGVLAAFDFSRTAGLAACAVAAFVLEWLLRTE